MHAVVIVPVLFPCSFAVHRCSSCCGRVIVLWRCVCFSFFHFFYVMFSCVRSSSWHERGGGGTHTCSQKGKKMMVVALHITTSVQDIRLYKNAESFEIPISSHLTPFIQLEKSISWTRISSRIRFSTPRLRQVLPKRGGSSSHPDEFCSVPRCNRSEELPGMWRRPSTGFFT